MKNELNVLYTCNERYAPFAGLSMFSLFENNTEIEKITVYMVLDDVSDENKRRYHELANRYGRQLVIQDAVAIIEKVKTLDIPVWRDSYAPNVRLFFPEYIRADTERLLYLDSDTLVVGSLRPLLELDMGSNCMAMVMGSSVVHGDSLVDYKAPYNSGVILFDVKNWQEGRWAEKLLDHIQNVRARYQAPDQDLLNVVCAGSILCLPPQYNSPPIHRVFPDELYYTEAPDGFYPRQQIQYAREHPAILHTYRFLGQFPWHRDSLHPDTEIFDSYLARSLWKDYQKEPSPQNLSYRAERILYRILPRSLFFRVFNLAKDITTVQSEKRLLKEEAAARK